MSIGEKIKEAMKENNIKHWELADKIYITQTTLSRYIADKRTPDAITLKALCEALDVSADWLLEIDETNKQDLKKVAKLKELMEIVAQFGGTVQASYVLSILE